MELPAEEDRIRLLQEVGTVLLSSFEGSVETLVNRAQHSAAALVDLVVESFPGFSDIQEFEGEKVFLSASCVLPPLYLGAAGHSSRAVMPQLYFLKRAQIFVADVWGAFGGEGPGEFHDIDSLTMFADYRVPQLLREWGVLHYSPELSRTGSFA